MSASPAGIRDCCGAPVYLEHTAGCLTRQPRRSSPPPGLTEAFLEIVRVTGDDWAGHLPGCGYTAENQNCGCAEWGGRLHDTLAKVVAEAEERGAAKVTAAVEAVLQEALGRARAASRPQGDLRSLLVALYTDTLNDVRAVLVGGDAS